jgi:hypothetical protein
MPQTELHEECLETISCRGFIMDRAYLVSPARPAWPGSAKQNMARYWFWAKKDATKATNRIKSRH